MSDLILLTRGAIKEVYFRPSRPGVVYYISRDNPFAQQELIQEYQKSVDIHQKLLNHFLNEVIIPLFGKESKAFALLSTFPSIEAVKFCIDLKVIPPAHFPEEDQRKLKDYFKTNKTKWLNVIEMQLAPEEDKIQGRFTLVTRSAKGNLQMLFQEAVKSDQLLEIASQMLNGIALMHRVGYIHGDLKLDNFLYAGEGDHLQIRLSDFSKSQELKPDEPIEGPVNISSWENFQTFAWEINSAGMLLLRMFEKQVLGKQKKRSLIQPLEIGAFIAHDSILGFDAFIMEGEPYSTMVANEEVRTKTRIPLTIVKLRNSKQPLKPISKNFIERLWKEKDRYIKALIEGLKEIEFAKPQLIDDLGTLLFRMTDIDPTKRPNINQVQLDYLKIANSFY